MQYLQSEIVVNFRTLEIGKIVCISRFLVHKHTKVVAGKQKCDSVCLQFGVLRNLRRPPQPLSRKKSPPIQGGDC